MIDRLRFLLDRPLDPQAARAAGVLATAILLGFGALFVLGAAGSGRPETAGPRAAVAHPRPGRSFGGAQVEPSPSAAAAHRRHQRRQDPQDEKGTPAAARVAEALRSHRALQHVPYRQGGLSVRLVGARGGRAVLAVSASTIAAARRGWRRFLRRCRDSGRSYVPHFKRSRAGALDG